MQHYVYTFFAELEGFQPKIWRRFQIVGSKTMAELGYTLMVLFEMQASHLFCITEAGPNDHRDSAFMASDDCEPVEVPSYLRKLKFELDFDEERWCGPDEMLYDADKFTLNRVTKLIGHEFLFNYDYGDNWNVRLTLEECEKQEISLSKLPRVLDGAGFGIIEDVGGTRGLSEFVTAMELGKGEAYEEYVQWYGETQFDIQCFDLDDINFRLKKLVRVIKEIYEFNYEPSQRALDIFDRKYQKKPAGKVAQFRKMRLCKQQMADAEVITLLENATNGVLAVSGDDGYPYAVPLSYAYLDGKIYFHSTSGDSHKIDAIRKNLKVSFCIVTKDAILPAEFNTLYQSVILFGEARILTEPGDIEKGIMAITRKYSGEYLEQGRAYAQKRQGHFLVVEIDIAHMTGKYGT